jgi:hypothetical protein
MPWKIKNQTATEYKPSATRRRSKLSPVNETREKALGRWNKLRQSVKRETQAKKEKRREQSVPGKYGRFNLLPKTAPNPPWWGPRATPGKYGRFNLLPNTAPTPSWWGGSPKQGKNVRVSPVKKPVARSPNVQIKFRNLQNKIFTLEEKISDMKRNFGRTIAPLEDRLEEYYALERNLKKKL